MAQQMAIEDEFLKPPLIHFSKANRQFPSGYKLRAALHTVGWHQVWGKLSRSTKLNVIAAHLRQELEGAGDSEERPRKITKGEKKSHHGKYPPGKRRNGAACAEWRGRPPFGRG